VREGSSGSQGLALGIDIGGTFTDVVLAGPSGIRAVAKRLTTPSDPAEAAVRAVADALVEAGVSAGAVTRVVHGTTLATNAILERRGAEVAFVTTRGFASLLPLGRHARVEEERYDLSFVPPPSPVDPTRIFEVTERLDATGAVITDLDEDELESLAKHLSTMDLEAIAVCLLHAHTNGAHERRVAEVLGAVLGPDIDIVVSSEVWPEVREYERSTTTAMSAYVGPVMRRYLQVLEQRLADVGVTAPLHVMESAGGVMSAARAARRAVATIESGPAAGVIAARVVGSDHGAGDVIAFDMGGTTAKAALVTNGEPTITNQFFVGGKGSFGAKRSGTGVPIKTPTIDLAEVGAGGGSIAWLDDEDTLHVGPRSAGADPGPVWYGRGGTQPTVTDASVVLGYLDPRGFADAEQSGLRFDEAASRTAFDSLAARVGVSATRVAAAVHEIANATMAGAIHVVTVQRGIDPRGYVLVASGGASPLHGARVAERFGIDTVIVPPAGGVASAVGLLASDLRVDRIRSVQLDDGDIRADVLDTHFSELTNSALPDLAGSDDAGSDDDRVGILRSVDLRFRGQTHDITVPIPDGPIDASVIEHLRDDFVQRHRSAFGVGQPGPLELVNVRLRATVAVPPVSFSRATTNETAPRSSSRAAWDPAADALVDTPVMALSTLTVGDERTGPALIETPESTILVPSGWTARCSPAGAVILRRSSTVPTVGS
jgi:N-methylhydantoinase A